MHNTRYLSCPLMPPSPHPVRNKVFFLTKFLSRKVFSIRLLQSTLQCSKANILYVRCNMLALVCTSARCCGVKEKKRENFTAF
jgi:ABC-type antimicrobial peptide transport system permease subunit